MKKITLKITIVSMLMVLMLAFAGCGSPSTLEEYLNSDSEAMEQIESLSESSGLEVDISDNTLTYTFTYDQTYTGDQLELIRTNTESTMESIDSSMEQLAASMEEESGINDVTIVVEYLNKDGSEIFKKEYK